jgi:hypothetical protein
MIILAASQTSESSPENSVGILIAAHKARNGGSLPTHDSTRDPQAELNEEGGHDDSVEVDHIIPQSRGGSNHPQNARLVSRELNNGIQRVVGAADKK